MDQDLHLEIIKENRYWVRTQIILLYWCTRNIIKNIYKLMSEFQIPDLYILKCTDDRNFGHSWNFTKGRDALFQCKI